MSERCLTYQARSALLPVRSPVKSSSRAPITDIWTGGARGIGLEVSRGLAEAGASIAIIYSSSKDAPQIAAEIAKVNRVHCAAFQSQVKDSKAIEATLTQIAKEFGKLDVVVANAGIASHYAAEDYTAEQWSEIMKVNLDGAFFTAQAAARIFKKQGSGNLIFTASVSAILVNVPSGSCTVGSMLECRVG